MPPLEAVKVLVSIMMSVSLSNNGKPLKLRHYDISRAHFQGTAQRLIYIRLLAEDRQKYSEDKVGRLVKSMYGTQDASYIWHLDHVNLTCEELGGFGRGKHSAALFHNPNEDVRMAVHGDDFVCLSDGDGLKHFDSLLISKYTAKDMGTLGFGDSGTDQTGQYLDIEPRHAPLIISESGCNANTKTVSTPREISRQTGVRRKMESDSEQRRCNKMQICLYKTFILDPRQIGSRRNREIFGTENERAS